MLLAIPIILLGLFLMVAAIQWRNGQWLESARWVLRRLSPHVLAGTAAAGFMIVALGIMLLWPPAFLLAFGAALYWLWTMAKSSQEGAAGRLPTELEPEARAAPPQARPTTQRALAPSPARQRPSPSNQRTDAEAWRRTNQRRAG